MDRFLRRRVDDEAAAEQSPISCLTRRLMDVHIDQKRSYSGSEDSVYFSAKSSQSQFDDECMSVLSQDATLQSLPANKVSDDTPSDSSDTLEPACRQPAYPPGEYSLINLNSFCTEGKFCADLQSQWAGVNLDEMEMKAFESPLVGVMSNAVRQEEATENPSTETAPLSKPARCRLKSAMSIITSMHQTMLDLVQSSKEQEANYNEQIKVLALKNEQLQSDLYNVETSYAQLHDRYEKLRLSLEEGVKIAEEWKRRSDEKAELVAYQKDRYQKLKAICEDKLVEMSTDRDRIKSESESKHHAMEAALRKANLTVEDLQKTLAMKNDQILQLNKLCDDVLSLKNSQL